MDRWNRLSACGQNDERVDAALVALVPAIAGLVPLLPLQIAGIGIAFILFFGAQSAAALLVEPDRGVPDDAGRRSP